MATRDKSKSQPPAEKQRAAPPSPIVGIGASAGGLDAFKEFFSSMPADSGMAFVLVQHLDPNHSSLLAELLARVTSLPVQTAEDGTRVRAGHVYVIPPNATMTIAGGRLKIKTPAPPRGVRRPIDDFFSSLAEDQGENAVCIVLAGVGSDGTLGLREIKAHAGLTLAQAADGHEAMTGMPHSAAETGLVDFVLPPREMPERLRIYRRNLRKAAYRKNDDGTRADLTDYLETITDILTASLGHDFSEYKVNTLNRRIQRRMQVLNVDEISRYVEQLRDDPDEAGALFREMLIGVTQFFRDPAAWQALHSCVTAKTLPERDREKPVRIWVAGCGTGEEAYSIAILMQEALRENNLNHSVQIFATDVDDRAIGLARAGLYPKPAPGLSAERMERWFTPVGEKYAPVKTIREMCIFAPHNLVKDPPFSNLDLLICRNLLIYLNSELQDKLLQKFFYALKPAGYLFLGLSENVSRQPKLFTAVDKKHRLFRRARAAALGALDLPAPAPTKTARQTREGGGPRPSSGDRIDHRAREIMEKHTPAYVVINREREVLRFAGGEIGRYLEPSSGAASLNFFSLVRGGLRPSVRALVQQAYAAGEPVTRQRLSFMAEGLERHVTVIAEPVVEPGDKETDLCVVAFREMAAAPEETTGDKGVEALKDELKAAKDQLDAALREQETTTEEARSASEEYQSVNEELQSSNEELETSKEEMQSINEELQTVNTELNNKNEELTRLNSDLRNLLESTKIATIFLDRDLHVMNFTPGVKELFHLRDTDRKRPLTDIATRLDYSGVKRDVAKVLRDLSVVEREVHSGDEASYIMRIRPYRTVEDMIDGVVITFVDITERRRHEQDQRRLASIVETTQDAIIGHLPDGTVTSWNTGAEAMFGQTAEAVVNRPLTRVIPEIKSARIEKALKHIKSGQTVDQFDIVTRRGSLESLDVSLIMTPIMDNHGKVIAASTIARDITHERRTEAQQDMLLHELSHRVKNALANVQAIALRTLEDKSSLEAFKATFIARLNSLARAHDLLLDSNWQHASLQDLIETEFAPFELENEGGSRFLLKGPEVSLPPKVTLALCMALHELATNATKYGALSVPAGFIELRWDVRAGADDEYAMHLVWSEKGGPRVTPPAQHGYGLRLIQDGIKFELDAKVDLDFRPGGLRCTIDVALDREAQGQLAKSLTKAGTGS